MGEPLQDVSNDTVSIVGLDDVFVTPEQEASTVQGTVDSDDFTVDEAAALLGVSVKTVRRRLNNGKLDGYKISGINGPEWRVKTSAVDNVPGQPVPTVQAMGIVQGTPDKNAETGLDTALVKELLSKLEILTYRTGYLEAQLASRDEEIKLLTDNSRPNWWHRFSNWMLGKQ